MPMHTCQTGGYCELCKAKRENAMMLRAVILRMELAIKYNGCFDVFKESGDLHDRIALPQQWMDLCLYNDGYFFEDVYQEAR